jgi:hypothetical protein
MDDRKKKNREVEEMKNKKRNNSLTIKHHEALSDEIATALISFGMFYLKKGFEFEQIMEANKIYKFSSVDFAVQVMMKDENGEIHHKFTPSIEYSSICKFCKYKKEEHSIFNDDQGNLQMPEESRALGSEMIVIKNNPQSNVEKDFQSKKELKIVDIKFSQNDLDLYEQPDLCYICCSNKIDEATAEKSDSCNHMFCMDCVKKHITSNINNANVYLNII